MAVDDRRQARHTLKVDLVEVHVTETASSCPQPFVTMGTAPGPLTLVISYLFPPLVRFLSS